MLGRCLGASGPSSEVCDGRDNNCDGSTDEGNPGGGGTCSTGRPGICAEGTRQCADGSLTCKAKVAPAAESCNGLDDSCDGKVDDGFAWTDPASSRRLEVGADCKVGVGACATAGKVGCSTPALADCRPGAGTPVAELRASPAPNGSFDWDCDGNETVEFDGTTFGFILFVKGSCDAPATYDEACTLLSPGAARNPSGFTDFFSYSCNGQIAACGERVIRFRCRFSEPAVRFVYEHVQAANESAPTGFYIPAVNRCR